MEQFLFRPRKKCVSFIKVDKMNVDSNQWLYLLNVDIKAHKILMINITLV